MCTLIYASRYVTGLRTFGILSHIVKTKIYTTKSLRVVYERELYFFFGVFENRALTRISGMKGQNE
jgi:hypothetical protein